MMGMSCGIAEREGVENMCMVLECRLHMYVWLLQREREREGESLKDLLL